MSKVAMKLGYSSVVVSLEDAMHIISVLEEAESYRETYASQADGGYTYNIWKADAIVWDFKVIPESVYAAAKLAGKPDNR